MASSKLLTQGKSAGSLKWTGSSDELKKFCEESLKIDELQWTRSDGRGANGDPFCCKVGEEVSIRWFPTTKTLQFQGKEVDAVKAKLLTSITNFNTDVALNSTRQSSIGDANTCRSQDTGNVDMNMNESILSQASEQVQLHCCCTRLSEELLNIREAIQMLSAGPSHDACRSDMDGVMDELQQLRLTLSDKENVIRSLEEENKSFKLALSLLSKEIASTESKTPATSGQNKEETDNEESVVWVPASKPKKKKKKKTQNKNQKDDHQPVESQTGKKGHVSKHQKHVLVLGDSVVKNVDGWRIGRSTKTRTTVKSFSGATVSDCYHYFKPPLESDPDQIIVHVGTNDLKTQSARSTAESIVDLTNWCSVECPSAKIAVSELTTRQDQECLDRKVSEVNKILKKFCHQNGWQFLSHPNIDSSSLNRSKLHLNKKGVGLIASNIIKFINNDK